MWTTLAALSLKNPKSKIAKVNCHCHLKRCLSSSSSSSSSTATLKSTLLTAAKLSRGLNNSGNQRTAFNGLVVTVFGCGGFLARHLLPRLTSAGCQVIAAYRPGKLLAGRPADTRVAGDLGQLVRSVPFDLRDEASLVRAMSGANVVVNAIGGHHLETPNFSFEDVHVTGASTIARIAQNLGIRRYIHLSALNSSLEPPESGFVKGGSGLLKAKARGEVAVRAALASSTIFRPADMYGPTPGESLLSYYLSNGACGASHRRSYSRLPLVNGGFGITKTPISVGDVAQGIVKVIVSKAADRLDGATVDAVGPRRYELHALMTYLQRLVCGQAEDRFPSGDLLQGGFRLSNLSYDPLFWARVSILTKLNKLGLFRDSSHAVVTWERIEREAVSDEPVRDGHLSLREVGVELSHLEDLWPHYLADFRRMVAGRKNSAFLSQPTRRESVELPLYTLDP